MRPGARLSRGKAASLEAPDGRAYTCRVVKDQWTPFVVKEEPAARPPEPKPKKIVDGGLLFLAAFTLASGLGVAWRFGAGRAWEIVLETGAFIAVLSPKIAAGLFIAGTLPMVLPRDRVAAWIGGESGWRGLVLGSVAGAAIPGGPMITFSLAAGFAAAGADLGAVIAFVSGWSLLSLNRLLIWELSFLPHDLVALRVLASLPFPLLIGWGVRVLVRRQTA